MKALSILLLSFLFLSPAFSQSLTEQETKELSVLLDSVILPNLFYGPEGEPLRFKKVATFVWASEQAYGTVYVGFREDLSPYIRDTGREILWVAKMRLDTEVYLPVVALKKQSLNTKKASMWRR